MIWRFLIVVYRNLSTICIWRNIVVSYYSAHSINYSPGTSVSIYSNCTTRNTAVELLWQDTVLIRDRKSTLFAYKPCRLNVSFTRWSDVSFFWAHTPEARALRPCQTAPDYWTKLYFALILSKHTRFKYRLSWLSKMKVNSWEKNGYLPVYPHSECRIPDNFQATSEKSSLPSSLEKTLTLFPWLCSLSLNLSLSG